MPAKSKGRPPIQDEFTHLDVSRQRKCQLRWERDGLCTACGEPVMEGGKKCEKHTKVARLAGRVKNGCRPWYQGGVGRPPIGAKSG